jgi:hypothetical protein
MTKELPVYEVLNPRGVPRPVALKPLVTRIPDLNDKVVYVLNVTRKVHTEEVMEAIAGSIRERFPRAEVIHVLKKNNYHLDEPELWEEVAAKADAAVVGPGD